MRKIIHLFFLIFLFQPVASRGQAWNEETRETYADCYAWVSFIAAQGTMPLLEYMGANKDQRDVLIVPIKWVHRTADIILPHKIRDKPVNQLITAERSANIFVEEVSLYWLKQILRGQLIISADKRVNIRTVAAYRIAHKAFFKMCDKALETQGNMFGAVKAGTRAGLAEAAYVGVTQAVRNAPFVHELRTYIQFVLPDDAYPRTFAQHMTKLGITIAAARMLAFVI